MLAPRLAVHPPSCPWVAVGPIRCSQNLQVLVFAPTNGKAPALNASGEIVVAPSIPAPLWHEYQITTGMHIDLAQEEGWERRQQLL
eukprot:scaffold4868_cov416-Prasinococcus_capsulatus_cf.AAC.11